MGSSDEMYTRGVRDAEYDDLNLFYYQHYYYYRLGYDQTRGTLQTDIRRFIPLILWIVGIGFGLTLMVAIYGFLTQTRTNDVQPALTPPPTISVATPTQPRPTPTAPPTRPPPPVLGIGERARVVNVGATALRARSQPGTRQRVVARFAEGSTVTIIEGPIELEGLRWWRIKANGASGWSAERGADGVVWLELVPNAQ